MAEISEDDIQMSERLTSSDGPEDDIRTRVRQRSGRTCWQSFSNSFASFCGIADEEQEDADKWQARLEDLTKDRIIGHGKGTDEDETDAAPHIRCSPRMPISLSATSKRCRRITLTEAKQAGLISTAIDGFKDIMAKPKKSLRKPTLRSRSFTPAAIREFGQSRDYTDYVEDVDVGEFKGKTPPRTLNDNFFSEPIGTSVVYRRKGRVPSQGAGDEQRLPFEFQGDEDEVDFGRAQRNWEESGDWMVRGRSGIGEARQIRPEALGFESGFGDDEADVHQEQRRRDEERQRDRDRISRLGDNANRREVNKGWFGSLVDQGLLARCFKFQLTDEARIHKHRPLFSIWMTFVQVLIFIVSVSVYGFAPWGYDVTIVSKEIIQPNLALKLESYQEKDNLWGGPRQKDLITLGAKFSPCMRRDMNVFTAINNDKVEENKTACCVYNDGSGCVQTREEDCSDTLAMWHKWSKKNPGGPENTRVSGSVCGQDPKTCRNPASLSPFVWPDDITKWPVCEESINSSNTKENRHLNCEVVGRPCCMGIQGECIITTRDHCDFYRGHFHEEATLCSQVKCMADICGMLPFGNPKVPDQFYRLWTCLFLHAGLIHLLVTVLFNVFVMVSIEQTIGWIRVVVIYMGSGVCGSLASAIFVPYHVEAGASGSQFGLLATQLVLVILFTHEPLKPSLKILGLLLGLLIIGLLPMVDNYAHLFGFVFGLLLSFAILPFARIKMGQMTVKQQRIIAMVVCSILATGLAALLIILFYVAPVYNCPGCQYFNCIPFTPTFCDTMEVKIRGVSSA